jgi:hypothetical protein
MAIRSKFELTVDFEYFWDRLSYGDSTRTVVSCGQLAIFRLRQRDSSGATLTWILASSASHSDLSSWTGA